MSTYVWGQIPGEIDDYIDASGLLPMDGDLTLYQQISEKTQPSGYASLGSNGLVPSGQLPTSIFAIDKDNIEYIFDGCGSAIGSGVGGYVEVGFDCTITAARMLPDQSTTTVVDIWKDTYANYPPTDADSITSSTPPTITAAIKSEDLALTSWTTLISSGDILGFNVDSNNNAKKLTVSLTVTRT